MTDQLPPCPKCHKPIAWSGYAYCCAGCGQFWLIDGDKLKPCPWPMWPDAPAQVENPLDRAKQIQPTLPMPKAPKGLFA